MFRYLPEQASEIAPKIDWINNLITDLSVFFTVAIVGVMIFFAIYYRKKDGVDHETPQIKGSHTLEWIWTVLPTLVCIYIAYYGVIYYQELRYVPDDAMVVNVVGQKWNWSFKYENGKETSNVVYVPVNRRVKFLMESKDVLHSFFIPAMRVKRDLVPGMYTYVSFTPVMTGEYHVFCTEYCGQDHYDMTAKLKVVSQAEYDEWVNYKEDLSAFTPVELGKKLYTGKGCNACHSLNGKKIIGPSFLKAYGREVELESGEKFKSDENYIKNSILAPNSQIVKGYPKNQMPAFEGQLDDTQIGNIIAFIKSLDGSQAIEEEVLPEKSDVDVTKLTPVERGKYIYQNKLCVTCHSLDGSKVIGPSFKGIYGREGELQDGTKYVVDDEYIKSSILKPMSQVVKGYPAAMPPYEGQLNDDDIAGVIEYMKTLK